MISLVIGSEGFIGTHLCNRLIERGDELIRIDAMLARVHGENSTPVNRDVLQFDVRDSEELSKALQPWKRQEISELYFLASDTSTGSSLSEIDEHLSQNVLSLATLLRVLSDLGMTIGRFILTSSRAVYGNGYFASPDGIAKPSPARKIEDLAAQRWELDLPTAAVTLPNSIHQNPRPVSIYGLSKRVQEEILLIWSESRNCKVNIYRLQNVAGYGQSLTNSYSGVITLLAQRAFNNEKLPIFEDGNIVRDFISVRDVAVALMTPLEGNSNVVDIGSGKPITLLDAAETLVEVFKSGQVEIVGEFRVGDVRAAWADTSETLSSMPSWRPSSTFRDISMDLRDWLESSSYKTQVEK